MQRDLFRAYLARFVQDDAPKSPRPESLGQVRNRSCRRLGNRLPNTNLREDGTSGLPLAVWSVARLRSRSPEKESLPEFQAPEAVTDAQVSARSAERMTVEVVRIPALSRGEV